MLNNCATVSNSAQTGFIFLDQGMARAIPDPPPWFRESDSLLLLPHLITFYNICNQIIELHLEPELNSNEQLIFTHVDEKLDTSFVLKLLSLLTFFSCDLIICLVQNIILNMKNYKSYFHLFNNKTNHNKIYDILLFLTRWLITIYGFYFMTF
jgi:hypothetical protein